MLHIHIYVYTAGYCIAGAGRATVVAWSHGGQSLVKPSQTFVCKLRDNVQCELHKLTSDSLKVSQPNSPPSSYSSCFLSFDPLKKKYSLVSLVAVNN